MRTARLAGMISINGISAGGTGEIGYWVAPTARRRAVLTEAARAVIDWGFSGAGPALQRLQWRAVAGNVASARSARALGFRYEGLLRGALANSFGRDDGWIAGLLPQDDRMPQPWPVLPD
ncbi:MULTISPECIES: GNAT family protein [unclassified Microbacterium]|uniref:GNAT family N-acetyltransferase n=1 Tax=unclassified Microbacterium TaxID=2609290 RepID=UPI002804FB2E|nr:GNAT family protein [Microbacterium sp. zg.B185]